ncbi:hypothetical protein L6164_036937 [Bauhinia variegata]|uniref:Uncharacterized protein n=1 Tax=Bauhinia variegata TaxID=167791 RepID=A0ACB9KIF2_BAUVA|nr:hypothetical protein L6164_036937 [Bauhinia variegata]
MLVNLEILDLSQNKFTSSIPSSIGNLTKLKGLSFLTNNFSHIIPPEVNNLTNLILDLSGNLLTGGIPTTLGELRRLETLNLSSNNLSGEIPSGFDDMSSLTSVDISDNQLRGPLPNNQAFHNATIETLRNNKGLCATEEFDNRYLIGVGGYGNVYKAMLSTVYECLEGGSLDKILNHETQEVAFDWNRRVNVVKDVANALSYMHQGCSSPIVHRDISSKNILLNLEYEAHISDFGTAKLLKHDSSNWTLFAGTFGYAAPG